MSGRNRIIDAEHIGGRTLRLTFSDGTVREVDLAGLLTGVLASLDDDKVFGSVTVDEVAGTVAWPNGIDLDPEVLHGDADPATGPSPTLIREYKLERSS